VPELGGWKRVNAMLLARGIEGVIIGQPPPAVAEAELEWNKFAAVAVGRAIRSPELSRVVLNHVESVSHLMGHMLTLGYRRIGLVMETEDCIKNSYRNVGAYHGSCEKLSIPENERVPPLLPGRLNAANLGEWIERWKVEAVIVHRPDQMRKYLPELGLRVPGDIGFAHISMHERSESISGLYFNPMHLGSWAVDLCHWTLDRGEKGLRDPTPSLMLTAYEWIEGETLRKPRPTKRSQAKAKQ
jgi:DNA-binding LacI/PurR family transcriptional regulator